MPMGCGDDQVFGAGAILDAVGIPPGDVPSFGVAADLRGDAAEVHIFFSDCRRHRVGHLLHSVRKSDDFTRHLGCAPQATEH